MMIIHQAKHALHVDHLGIHDLVYDRHVEISLKNNIIFRNTYYLLY